MNPIHVFVELFVVKQGTCSGPTVLFLFLRGRELFAGPIFSREAMTAPRQLKHFLTRSGYIAILFVLMYTVGQITFGWQQIRNIGDYAVYGNLLFQVFALVQLSLVLFFSMLFAASFIAQEKDRQTLILLLMTDLKNRELVLGKLFSSFLTMAVLIASSVPVFLFIYFLGGVTLEQIGWAIALCIMAAFTAGSWGALVAFWKEKTFQTLTISLLGLLVLIGAVEALDAFWGQQYPVVQYLTLLNPFRSMQEIINPLASQTSLDPVTVSAKNSVLALFGLAILLNAITIFQVRKWNPSRSVFISASKSEGDEEVYAPSKRSAWDYPVIWREICTRAYGRKILLIKLAYIAIAGFFFYQAWSAIQVSRVSTGILHPSGYSFFALALLSLIMINAQAVTSFTSERDMKTLELLLMTDITAKEFIMGKLGGIFYNTKELILIPIAMAGMLTWLGMLSLENCIYLSLGYLILVIFVSMLGLHSGLTYSISRSAIANSLGTVFFLFIGIFIFMLLLMEARSSFFIQFQSFIIFIGVGSLGLYASLASKNPSNALLIAAGMLPFLTFYAITEFLLAGTLGVCISIIVAYGFTTLAMLIPAVSEFDIALGRSTME